jgi:hypothetical protein
MDREYEIFGSQSDGSISYSARASGLRNTRSKLVESLLFTGKEHFAVELSTREIVFAADVLKVGPERAKQRIFQIAYTDRSRIGRAKLLRSIGCAVMSTVGNEAARVLLTTFRPDNHGIGLCIVGDEPPIETRKEMVDWLKANYSEVRILALNRQNESVPGADYNVEQSSPDVWIRLVASTISSLQAA